MSNNPAYLTEESLGKILEDILPGKWLHDKSFIGRLRPDWRCEARKLIVEFDGFQHYTSVSRILNDIKKDLLEIEAGYTVIRIPYFIQISTDIVKMLFNVDANIIQEFPHGFIDRKCVLPADYCELGLKKFKNDLKIFDIVSNEIKQSLKNKINELGDVRLVLPESISLNSL